MELDSIIISTLQVSRIALNVSYLFRADVKKKKFHGDTFSSCPTLPGCSLKVSHMSFGQTEFPSPLPQHRGLRRPGCPSPALTKGTRNEVMKENLDSQIRIIPMLHWHTILNKASYFYQHIFTSVFHMY
jgi:hypothetical protein